MVPSLHDRPAAAPYQYPTASPSMNMNYYAYDDRLIQDNLEPIGLEPIGKPFQTRLFGNSGNSGREDAGRRGFFQKKSVRNGSGNGRRPKMSRSFTIDSTRGVPPSMLKAAPAPAPTPSAIPPPPKKPAAQKPLGKKSLPSRAATFHLEFEPESDWHSSTSALPVVYEKKAAPSFGMLYPGDRVSSMAPIHKQASYSEGLCYRKTEDHPMPAFLPYKKPPPGRSHRDENHQHHVNKQHHQHQEEDDEMSFPSFCSGSKPPTGTGSNHQKRLSTKSNSSCTSWAAITTSLHSNPNSAAAAANQTSWSAITTSLHSDAASSTLDTPKIANTATTGKAAMEVEIAPGVTAPLRGAQETTQAVRHDFIMNLICWGCEQEIYCIADCRWALCPGCRSLSPMDGKLKGTEWGLGLGITPKTLEKMRYDEFSRSSFF